MAYDPAWDMPQVNWQQQGSFESGQIPPAVAPDAGTQICIGPIAREWLYVVLGALDQLRNPSSWIVADDAAMDTVLRQVDKLREIIAVGEGCQLPTQIRLSSLCVLEYSNDGGVNWIAATDWVTNFGNCVRSNVPPPVPFDPNPDHRDKHACNIAGYLAQKFLEVTLEQMVAYLGTTFEALAFANSLQGAIIGFARAFPLSTAFVSAVSNFYNIMRTQLLTEVEAARDDPSLWSAITCSLYGAIRAVGYVDSTNFAACQSALYAITTPYVWLPTALGNYWGDLGLGVIQELQNVGAIDVIDCTSCSVNWCTKEDYTLSQGCAFPFVQAGVRPTTYVLGTGWVGGYNAGNNSSGVDIETYFADCTGTNVVAINGVSLEYVNDGPAGDVEFSYYNTSHGVRAQNYAVPANSSGVISDSFSPISVTTLVAQIFNIGNNVPMTIVNISWTGTAAENPNGQDTCS